MALTLQAFVLLQWPATSSQPQRRLESFLMFLSWHFSAASGFVTMTPR